MATHFYPLTVLSVTPDAARSVVVKLQVPPELRPTFAYTQGQHLTVRATIQGQEVRRNYSLCSSPLDEEWAIAIKQVDGGLFSTWANTELRPGATLEAMPPMGRFYTPLHAASQRHYLAIAAGSGITPMLSIISTTLRAEPHSTFTLVYGNRNRGSIMFKEALEALKDKYLQRFRLIHILSRERTDADIHFGRIDAAKCQALLQVLIPVQHLHAAFLCGPEGMIQDARTTLLQAGLDAQKIHAELFATSQQASQRTAPTGTAPAQSQPQATITMRIDGIESSFGLGYHGPSLLDAALATGADLPYACKGGVCCTCKARLTEGEVHMDVVYGLEPDEIAAGYILTCQSHPRTPMVRVDFDQ